jgi:1-acyl-sn-glycerol-3-phosphate acyltransferase
VNRQPYEVPPRKWPSLLTPWYVTLTRPFRRHALKREQRFVRVRVRGAGPVRRLLDQGAAVLVTPNHSFHYDSYVLIEAATRLGRPCHFLTAWQVFAMSTRLQQLSLQRHGCFSVDREAADLAALRQAIDLMRDSPFPLVVFPEGDIYHTNDLVRPFREGAAAIALASAKRATRPVVCVPCALKCWYVTDPRPALERSMARLEKRLGVACRSRLPLPERVVRFGEDVVAWQEQAVFGVPRTGPLRPRIAGLAGTILDSQEKEYGVPASGGVSERVQALRRRHIRALADPALPPAERAALTDAMEQLFRVVQLWSYPGNYVTASPTAERLAETVDKLEEDVLDVAYPSVKGDRAVTVWFGEPVVLAKGGPRDAGKLTETLQSSVQGMLDAMNAEGV